jgi:hypothetical protein
MVSSFLRVYVARKLSDPDFLHFCMPFTNTYAQSYRSSDETVLSTVTEPPPVILNRRYPVDPWYLFFDFPTNLLALVPAPEYSKVAELFLTNDPPSIYADPLGQRCSLATVVVYTATGDGVVVRLCVRQLEPSNPGAQRHPQFANAPLPVATPLFWHACPFLPVVHGFAFSQ